MRGNWFETILSMKRGEKRKAVVLEHREIKGLYENLLSFPLRDPNSSTPAPTIKQRKKKHHYPKNRLYSTRPYVLFTPAPGISTTLSTLKTATYKKSRS